MPILFNPSQQFINKTQGKDDEQYWLQRWLLGF